MPTLNLTHNTALTTLECYENTLETLDLSKNTALTALNCSKNVLKNIYIGSKVIATLDCSNNQFEAINVAPFTKLTELNCSHNLLRTLDIARCTTLANLDCSYNELVSLDISARPSLTTLDCSNNPAMIKLWVKDDAQQGAVDITKDNTTHIYYNNGGITIPDAELKKYLVNNYDDDGDGVISIAEADNITMVNCSGKGVADLTGLEACTNLVTLNCSNNNIAKIELPNLAQLRTLTCNGNPIKYINLDNCVALEYLNLQGVTTNAISGNNISIDNYSQAESLYLTIKNTHFTTMSLKNSPKLTALEFYGEFAQVTVTDNTALTSLIFYAPVLNATLSGNTALQGIDISALTLLETLDVQKCNLQSLDVTKNLALTSLICNNNALTTLDVSNNTSLTKLYCNNNKLPRINVTANTALQEFDIANNLLSALNIRNNTALTYLCVSNNAEITMVDVKYNTALKELYCNGLAIGELNIVNNTALTTLQCHTNKNLTTLTCSNSFDFTNTHISIDKGLNILGVNGTVLTPSVGDLITVNLGVGVVFDVSNASIKMISVEETSAKWSTEFTVTFARDSDNGANNMATIKAHNPDLSKYPVFKWCDDYGTDWYLPSIDELSVIYKNRSTINSTLSAKGYTTLGTGYYWSSTEYNNSIAYLLKFNNGISVHDYSKDYAYSVRAVLAF